jgi:hypothetical protein
MGTWIRTGSKFKRFVCQIDERCVRLPPGVHIPQIEDHSSGGETVTLPKLSGRYEGRSLFSCGL